MRKLVENTPVGTTRGVAHFNMGDKPHEWREVENPVYSPEDEARSQSLRKARVAANLSLRETCTLLEVSVVDLSSLERGRKRFESPDDQAWALKTIADHAKPDDPDRPKREPIDLHKLWTNRDRVAEAEERTVARMSFFEKREIGCLTGRAWLWLQEKTPPLDGPQLPVACGRSETDRYIGWSDVEGLLARGEPLLYEVTCPECWKLWDATVRARTEGVAPPVFVRKHDWKKQEDGSSKCARCETKWIDAHDTKSFECPVRPGEWDGPCSCKPTDKPMGSSGCGSQNCMHYRPGDDFLRY